VFGRKPEQIDIKELVNLAISSNTYCSSIKFAFAPLTGINGQKWDLCNGEFEVLINESIDNRCLIRFTIAKEISGIIMDSSISNWQTTKPSELLENISSIHMGQYSSQDSDIPTDLLLDELAELGACELLLPVQYANFAKKKYHNEGSLAVAHYFKIPEKWVQRRFGIYNELF
jgi:hypothetical protein